MLSVEELQGFIDADSVTETHAISYSVQDVRTNLAYLCPAADAQDEFDADAKQAIAESALLEIPLDRVQFILEQLPDSAAAGASGWTYAAIKAISLSNGDTIARATTAICKLLNLMLAGKLLSPYWLNSRSVCIPKEEGSPQPIDIWDAW